MCECDVVDDRSSQVLQQYHITVKKWARACTIPYLIQRSMCMPLSAGVLSNAK